MILAKRSDHFIVIVFVLALSACETPSPADPDDAVGQGSASEGGNAQGGVGQGGHDSTAPTGGASADGGNESGSGGQALPDTDALAVEDQLFLTIDGLELRGDIRVPRGAGPFPLVVLVHGGGFVGGDKSNDATWAMELEDAGLATFAVNYRLVCGSSPLCVSELTFPGPVQDIKCAIQWMRANAATYRVDPGRVAVFGSSAGGYLSQMVGASSGEAGLDPSCPGADGFSNSVGAAVAYFGISDWGNLVQQRIDSPYSSQMNLSPFEASIAGSPCLSEADQTTVCAGSSPLHHVTSATPPMFLLHSEDDPTIPVQQSRQMMTDVLSAAGTGSEYLEVTGQGHGWYSKFADPDVAAARDAVIAWLQQTL